MEIENDKATLMQLWICIRIGHPGGVRETMRMPGAKTSSFAL